ncbi:MauE/DoxX family redox-associated membrane protein [Pedobacter cryophilus]|nr:MauE/DoxX family redox-associated membrane protein [Pedobacter cryophilus]
MMNYSSIRVSTTFFLTLLWSYAAIAKLLDPSLSLSQMRNQVFPNWMADVLAFALPFLELLLVTLLLVKYTYKVGLYLSTLLLTAFTLYIILVKLLVFDRVPCSCGGVLSEMSWTQHLFFNLFFLALSITAIYFEKLKHSPADAIAERRNMGNKT